MTVGVLTAAAVVYILSLLSMYLYALSEQDALDLTSFGRYTAVYFLGWAFVLFGLAIQQSGGPRRRVAWFVAVALTGLAVATAPPASADWLLDKPTLRSERILIRSQMERVDRHVPLNESVSILWQQTQGFEFWILRYELAPRQSNLWNFAFGGPYYPGDVWTSDVSDTQFVETVVHFDFLMVAHADGLFWQRYGHLFAPSARGLTSALFRIRRRTDGGADFTLVTRL